MEVGEKEPACLIAAARAAVARSSIRHVAIQIGLSHGALWNLVQGKTRVVYAPTINRLRRWYLRECAEDSEGLTAESASYLVQRLLGSIDDRERQSAGLELLGALDGIYKRHATSPPAWLASLAEDRAKPS